MRNIAWILLLALTASDALASSTTIKQADTIQNSTGGAAIAVPSVGANFVTDTATQTLTNKTVSAPVLSGTVTGTYTLGGTPTIAGSAVSGNISGNAANVTGTVVVANGGTGLATLTSGSVLVGAGTSSPTLVAPSTSGNVLTSNGSTWVSSAPASTAPSVTGTYASGTSITAVGGITFAGSSNALSVNYIVGSGGAVTVTASPQVSAGSVAGQQLTLIGTSATNTVKLQDGTGLALNGPWIGAASSSLVLVWDSGASVWREIARNN